MPVQHSYVFQILAYLSDGLVRSTQEISSRLQDVRGALWRNHDFRFDTPANLDELAQAMHDLKAAGLVVDVNGEIDNERGKGSWQSVAALANGNGHYGAGGGDGDGGGGDGGAPGGGGGAADGPGGAGLSEVLAHPVLLCLPAADQDRLLEEALTAPDDGGDGAVQRSGARRSM